MRALLLATLALTSLALALASCSTGGSSGPSEPTIPEVIDISPADGAIHVQAWSRIYLRFNTDMDRASVEGALTLSTPDRALVPHTATWMGKLLELEPADQLEDETVYTVTVGAGATGSGGEPMAGEFVATFTTRPSHPVVLSTIPADGADEVPRNARIRVEFSEAMDEGSTAAGIVVDPPVGYTLTHDWNFLEFDFLDDLDALTTYSITIPGTAEGGGDGQTLGEDYVFGFTTGIGADDEGPYAVSFDPPRGSRNVSRDLGEIVVTFSEPIVDMSGFDGIDMRFFGLIVDGMQLNEDQTAIIFRLRRLPPGEELWFDLGTFEDLQGLVGEDTPPYSITTAGGSEIFPVHEGDAWFYVDYDVGESFVVRLENSLGNRFDMIRYVPGDKVWDDFDEISEIRHFLCSGDLLSWTGFVDGDDASEFTPPLQWLRFPLQAGSAWSDSTEFMTGDYTIRVNYSCEVVDVADYSPDPLALIHESETLTRYIDRSTYSAFPDCAQVRFEYLMRVFWEGDWAPLESGDQRNFFCPGVGLVHREDITTEYDVDGNPQTPEASEFRIGGWMLDQ